MSELIRAVMRWFSLSALAVVGSGCSQVPWDYSLESGLGKAASYQCPVLVQFHSPFSPACWEVEQGALSDPEVLEVMRAFVPVRLDVLISHSLAKELAVETVPAFFIMRSDRTVAAAVEGDVSSAELKAFLLSNRRY